LKRFLAFVAVLLVAAAFFAGCDRQKALDQILSNPETKAYLMSRMMEDEQIKSDMADQLLADTAWVKTIIDRLGEQAANRDLMLTELLSHDGMGEIMLEKMAENQDLKNKMKEIGRRK
jgi:hypothetical protein